MVRVAVATAVAGMMALVVLIGVAIVTDRHDRDHRAERSRGDGLTAADVEPDTPVRQPPPLDDDIDLVAWSTSASERSGVPARALRAYAAAELAQRAATPDCRLSWITLAGIGRVESDHGRFGGARLGADGTARPTIIGPPLDGSPGVREIRDTDGGRLDGDPVYDRAVGPMQFLPGTWARYGADGNGDGVEDPNQLDDAALAAARYLCANGRDTASGEGWWDGVLTYNSSLDYARLVWAAADRYRAATAA
ncbi:MAG TPA: lytic murein transglycosylase [Pseudonocardia sp.]|jgi:membrane-bound lytic murein transglycosylase B|uniref:lytic transglycosylase domain-containing protein n=1 Tax=Pseudonocardia sp. TaxID=60912 RepID=UPI002B4ABE80|nr:lytic murein transglycosylase [Pseudonocardia sp.]HLU58337.1 lytic murein transglycosylase [Pseudonocardia sp.]